MFRYLGASTKFLFDWNEGAVVGRKQRHIAPNVWLNKAVNSFADGVGRMQSKQKIIMD